MILIAKASDQTRQRGHTPSTCVCVCVFFTLFFSCSHHVQQGGQVAGPLPPTGTVLEVLHCFASKFYVVQSSIVCLLLIWWWCRGATTRKGAARGREGRWRPGGKRGVRGGEAVGRRVSKGGSSGLWMKRHLKVGRYCCTTVLSGVLYRKVSPQV